MERLSSTISGKFDTSEKMDDKESVAALPERLKPGGLNFTPIDRISQRAKSSTPYFTIRVLNTGKANNHCYLNTEDNSMRYSPQVTQGNTSTVWILREQTDSEGGWSISNAVTESSNSIKFAQPTYMNLGAGVFSTLGISYRIVLLGPDTRFFLESSTQSKFAIYTYAGNSSKAYLQPLSTGDPQDVNVIGAKIEETPSYFFDIQSTKLPNLQI